MSEATTTPFDAFSERIKAFSTLVEAVAETRLKAAQAELAEATAAGQWVRARVIETALAQLQTDFEAVNRARITARRKCQDLEARAHAASMLLQGAEIAAFSHARDAYKFFEKQALIEGDPAIFSTTIAPNTITGEQFLDNRHPSRPCSDPPASNAAINALQLMDWALRQQYIARSGTAAQQHVTEIFHQIAQVARTTLAAINRARDTLQCQVYGVWNPIHIVGSQPSPAESRILVCPGPDAAS